MGISDDQFAFSIKHFTDFELNILYAYLKEKIWFKKYQQIMLDFNNSYNNENAVNEQLILPFIKQIDKILNTIIVKNIHIDNNVVKTLCQSIVDQLNRMTWKCLIIEMEEYKKNNSLKGENGNARYLDFLNKNYKTPNQIEAFYCKYPVLARLIIQKMLDLTSETEQMLNNIDVHFVNFKDTLKLKSNYITEVICSQGDTHRRGKSVAKIILSNGEIFIYKPRNSYIEKAFYNFIDYINKYSNLKEFYINKVYYTKDFTIESYIEFQPCNTIEDVKEYYYRFGTIIALTSLLQGTDFHSENLIAFNKYPVIVDFETLFTQLNSSYDEEREYVLSITENEILNLSATALLPLTSLTNNIEKKGIDVSSLAGGDAVELPMKVLQIRDIYMDTMHYEFTYINKNPDKNKPTLNGDIQNFNSYKEDIYAGFGDILDYFMKNKKSLYNIINQLFENIEVRQVLKPTAIYSALLLYTDHPNYLKDMIYMERLLDNSYSYPHRNKKIVLYEIADMQYLEIPIFHTNTSEKYLVTSSGVFISNYYKESALNSVISKINRITYELIQREKTKLKILLGDYMELITKRMNHLSNSLETQDKQFNKEEILEVCLSIGRTIIASAYFSESKKNISWRNIEISQNYPMITFMNNSLYSGRTGILYYLYYLSKVSSDKEIMDFTKQLFSTIDTFNEEIKPSIYNGQASALYVKMKFDNLSNNDFTLINDMLMQLRTAPIGEVYDWLGGIAGYIKLLNEINQYGIEKDNTRLLIDQYTSYISKLIYENKIDTNTSIGFGHGEIGLVFALLIGQYQLKKDFKKEINLLLDKIDIKLQNFKTNDFSNQHSWCHGFGGLGIGALACKEYLDDPRLDRYIDYSFHIIAEADPIDMCMCHGMGGDIDFLISMSQQYPKANSISEVLERKISKIIAFYNAYGIALLNELPEFRDFSLYTGLSGVGLILLRSINPELIPSALTL